MRDQGHSPRAGLSEKTAAAGQVRFKEIVDRAAAAGLLLASAPLLLGSAIAILLDDGPPVLFEQKRVGRKARVFIVHKFRSMRVHDASVAEVGQVTGDHALVTPVGRLLRRFKIDELPQLISVLRGDMSIVGPRPTVPEQVSDYGSWQRRRLEVRPGLTGWAQVNGNVRLTWEERIALDVWYVDHWTISLDLRILAKTLRVLIWGESRQELALEEALEYEDSASRRGR